MARDPEVMLAKQFVTVACLDYVALAFPDICKGYLRVWYRREHGGVGDFAQWLSEQENELSEWLANEGYSIALLVDMDAYVDRVRRVRDLPEGKHMAQTIEHGQYTTRKHREHA